MTTLGRRDFLQAGAIAASGIGALNGESSRVGVAARAASDGSKWYTKAYRRAVIDMHIPDWDPAFLSKFDPQAYAERLVQSRAQSIVCYCQSHVGLFNFPTKVGTPHKAFAGRNMLREMIDAVHKRGIAVQLYTSLIFDRTAADQHPEWRMKTWEGKFQGEGGRHGVLCVNSSYREYVRSFVQEICENFDFEGIRFDMTFWPWLCFCDHCEKRFDAEVGGKIPRTIDWLNEKWVAFQRRREAWLTEFASVATGTVRKFKPSASVEHQSSTFPLNWMFGVTAPLAQQNDFLQGDFYGDSLQGSFVRKLLEDLTPHRPFGYETSFSVALKDHTARKPESLLEAKAAAAIGDHAAFIFIDAIDPVGTVNPHPHARMGRVFDRFMQYYGELGGNRVGDFAIYFSPESKFDFAANGRPVSSPDTSDAHTTASMQAARRILEHQFPLSVVTKHRLANLAGVKTLLLCNVNMMDAEECAAIRQWVRQGGTLYASGGSSLVTKQGKRLDDFQLAEVFGVSIVDSNWLGKDHYIAPTRTGQPYFPEFDADYPAFSSGYGMGVKAHPGAAILATRTNPWPAPNGSMFASIHSNPPWIKTDEPELVMNTFGKGRAIYSATPIELLDTLSDTFVMLLEALCPMPSFEGDGPKSVEVTLFHQPDRKRYSLTATNFQKDLPNIPVEGMKITCRVPEKVQSVTEVPTGAKVNAAIKATSTGSEIEFVVPRLETLCMIALKY